MAKFKVESGIQLLARLHRRPDAQHFYPILFESGPRPGEVIEIVFSEDNASCLLMDMVAEALMPTNLGGAEVGLLYINTDGSLDLSFLENVLRKKLLSQITNNSQDKKEYTDKDINNFLLKSFSNLLLFNLYDASQMYATIQNLEKILAENSSISLVIFDTLSAFYWSEQGFKITKMDTYLKYVLKMLKKVTKDYKITILYTRPEYFSSSKDVFDNVEGCLEQHVLDCINCRVMLSHSEKGVYQINVQTFSKNFKRTFKIFQHEIKWS